MNVWQVRNRPKGRFFVFICCGMLLIMKKQLTILTYIYALATFVYLAYQLGQTYMMEQHYYGQGFYKLIWITILSIITWVLCIKQSKEGGMSKPFLMSIIYTIAFVDGISNIFIYSEYGKNEGMIPIIPGLITVCIIFLIFSFNKNWEEKAR